MRKKYSKICIICILMMLALPGLASAEKASGTEGDISWTLEDGILTISGEEDMPDWQCYWGSYPPWYEYRDNVTKVIIENGVTDIGNFAFFDMGNLLIVEIPESVTSIGEGALEDCEKLQSIDIPDSVTIMGEGALANTGLKSLKIPNGLTSITWHLLGCCKDLEKIEIPEGVTGLEFYCIHSCTSLKSITLPSSVNTLGAGVFYACSSLSSIFFCSPELPEIVDVDDFVSNESAFRGVTASAYYPSTWSETPTSGYGGTITWIPVDAPSIKAVNPKRDYYPGETAVFSVKAEETGISCQ